MLTPEGRAWALREAQNGSTLACVALTGAQTGWPACYVETAVEVANEQALKVERAAVR